MMIKLTPLNILDSLIVTWIKKRYDKNLKSTPNVSKDLLRIVLNGMKIVGII